MFKILLSLLSFFTFCFAAPIQPFKAFIVDSTIQNEKIYFDFKIAEDIYVYKNSFKIQTLFFIFLILKFRLKFKKFSDPIIN